MPPRSTPLDPAIHRVRLDKLRIFEISEAELDALERGSPESLSLNFGLTVLATAISFTVSLTTTEIDSNRTFIVFVIVTVVGYLAAAVFTVRWLVSRKALKSTAAQIRARDPSVGIQETAETIG